MYRRVSSLFLAKVFASAFAAVNFWNFFRVRLLVLFLLCFTVVIIAHISVPEDGEISEHGSESEVNMASPTRRAHLGNSSADTRFTASSSKKGKRDKKLSKYDKLNNRMNKIENMLENMQRFLDKQEPPRTETNVDKGRKKH